MSLSEQERRARRELVRAQRRRRRLAAVTATVLALAAAALVVAAPWSGRSPSSDRKPAGAATSTAPASGSHSEPAATKRSAAPALPPIRPAVPGKAEVVARGPVAGRKVALTFDDGFCERCIARIVRVLERTGAHATFFPNGTYGSAWDPHAAAIRRLIARGQVTVGSHTFSHVNAPAVGAAAFTHDLDRNEAWIEHTFHVSGRPYLRPPYGAYDAGTLAAAGQRGYTKVVMWSGTVADSNVRTIPYLMKAIRDWAKPGVIILMHANYMPTAEALPQMLTWLRQHRYTPVTVAELLGT